MSKLGWGKNQITQGCISKWYRGFPIGKMVEYMRDNHRLLAQEHGGGIHKDSVLVYDEYKFMQALNLPTHSIKGWKPNKAYIELSTAVKMWWEYIKRNRIKVEFESLISLSFDAYKSEDKNETLYFPNIEISTLKEKVDQKAKELRLRARDDWEVATHNWVDVTENVCYFRVYLDSENEKVFVYVRNYNKGLQYNTQKTSFPVQFEYPQGHQQVLNL